MPAHRAYSFLYTEAVRGRGDFARLEIDALLGDAAAARELAENRTAAIDGLDVEVG